jgi:hypothetical protein
MEKEGGVAKTLKTTSEEGITITNLTQKKKSHTHPLN